MKKIRYNIKGMSCASCVVHVEHAAAKVAGKENVNVSLLTNTLTVTAGDEAKEEKLFSSLSREIKAAGYAISREDDGAAEHRSGYGALVSSAVLTLILMYISMGHMLCRCGCALPGLRYLAHTNDSSGDDEFFIILRRVEFPTPEKDKNIHRNKKRREKFRQIKTED
jgi:cation transport ATPase